MDHDHSIANQYSIGLNYYLKLVTQLVEINALAC